MTPDLLVVGLGRTGTVAYESARAASDNVIGLDHHPPTGEELPGCAYDTRVWGLFSDGTVACSTPDTTACYSPKAVIVASGATDIPLPVPGWHLPGAIGAREAARELDPGTTVVVLRGPHARAGRDAPDLGRLHIVHDEDLAIGNPIEIRGHAAVEAIRIGDNQISASHVVLDNGLQTENHLARMAGIASRFSASSGGDVIRPSSVFAVGGALITVIGNAAGIGGDRDTLLAEAAVTARLLTESGGDGHIPGSIPGSRVDWDYGGVPILPAQSTDDTLACPDAGVTIGEVRTAIELGATTVNDVKRRTRAAMAACQGRDCLWTIRALLAEHRRSFDTPMTARPPVTTITLGELATLPT